MEIIGRGYVHQVDLRVGDELAPVGRVSLPAEPGGELSHCPFISAADGLQPRLKRGVKEGAHLAVSIGMGPAHELIADQPDPDLSGHDG
jgi:hypothetical protein